MSIDALINKNLASLSESLGGGSRSSNPAPVITLREPIGSLLDKSPERSPESLEGRAHSFEKVKTVAETPKGFALFSSLIHDQQEYKQYTREELDDLFNKVIERSKGFEPQFVTPMRRNPPIGIDYHRHDYDVPLLPSEQVLKVHRMYIRSPSPFFNLENPDHKAACDTYQVVNKKYQYALIDLVAKGVEGWGITEKGKNVILQQGHSSCGPTCVAMLALDCQRTFDWEKICGFDAKTNIFRLIDMFKTIGLTPIWSRDDETAESLASKIAENGPGIIAITAPIIGGHGVIIDEISIKENQVTIRDPFEGRQMTIPLDAFLSWGPYDFIQLAEYPKELY